MRSKFATALSLLLFVSACGGESSPQSPDNDDEAEDDGSDDDAPSSSRDAGSKDAGARDAGSKDAGKSSDAGSSDAGGDAGKSSDAGSSDAGKGTDAGKADAGSACDALTYNSFGKAFLTNYCTGCHTGSAAPDGVRLDTLAGVTTAKAKVKAQVAASAMPPLGSKAPTAQERTNLSQWIDCGPK